MSPIDTIWGHYFYRIILYSYAKKGHEENTNIVVLFCHKGTIEIGKQFANNKWLRSTYVPFR